VRVLAVAKLFTGAIEREHEVLGKRLVALEPGHDGGVVRGGAREGLERKCAARVVAQRAVLTQLREHVVVLSDVADDGDPRVVLRRRARHRRPADVDGLDVRRLPERVEVAHHHVERRDVVLLEVGEM
jgi:hypothetical protein